MNQLSIDWDRMLDPHAKARSTDPESSHIAAAHAEASGRAKVQRAFAFGAVRSHPGKTSAELAQIVSRGDLEREKNYRILGRRLPELRDDNVICNGTEKRLCTVSGREAITWWPR